MNRVLDGEVMVLPRTKWIVDVFTGKGWDNYSCFRIYKGSLKLVGGMPITEEEYKILQSYL